jgi:hypothetical protein
MNDHDARICDMLRAMKKEIRGPHPYIHALLCYEDDKVSLWVYEDWPSTPVCRVEATSWEEGIIKLRAVYNNHLSNRKTEIVHDLALEIIRLTDTDGQCTDAGLRLKFAPDDIAEFADDAVVVADRMATNGPFKVVRTSSRPNR